MDSSKNGIKSAELSNNEKAAAVAWQGCREIFPVQNPESDFALRLRLKLMAQIVDEIGQDRFMEAVEKAISVSFGRYAVSPARIRECAGLRWTPPPSPAAQAWALVTQVFIDHCRTDENGNYRLEEKIVNVNGVARVFAVPELSPAIKRAIQGLGGWAGLAEAWPEYWSGKLRDFRELYHEDEPGPRMDSLQRVK
jgi:hypothetical protein